MDGIKSENVRSDHGCVKANHVWQAAVCCRRTDPQPRAAGLHSAGPHRTSPTA